MWVWVGGGRGDGWVCICLPVPACLSVCVPVGHQKNVHFVCSEDRGEIDERPQSRRSTVEGKNQHLYTHPQLPLCKTITHLHTDAPLAEQLRYM